MTHGQRGRVPIPTNEEIAEAEDLHREIVAVSAIQYGPLNYMKFAFRNGATSTASLGTEGALSLFEALTAVTLHEILRLGRFFAFAAGNSETRTDSSLEFAANVRMPDERRRAV